MMYRSLRLPLFLLISIISIVATTGCGNKDKKSAAAATGIQNLKDKGLKALNYSEFSDADKYADSLLNLGEKENNPEATLYGKIIKGQASMYTGNFEECYPALHEAEAMAIRQRNDSALASAYNGLGIYSMNIEKDNNEALRCFFLGLDAARRSGSERLHSLLLCNVASVYYLSGNPMGLRYGMECYTRGKALKDEYLRFIGSMTVAFSHMAREEYDQALNFIKEAEVVMRSYNIKEGATLYCLYGMILRKMGKDEDAERAFQESIQFYKDETANTGDIRSFTELGEMLAAEGKYNRALEVLESGLKYYELGHEVTFKSELLTTLAHVYRLVGKPDKAKEYDMIRLSESNSIQNHEKETAIAQLRSKYDLERVENEINRQRVEILEKRNQIYILAFVSGIGLCILISIIMLYRHKSRLYTAIVRQMTESVREETRLRDTIRGLETRIQSLLNNDETSKSSAADTADHHVGEEAIQPEPHTDCAVEPDAGIPTLREENPDSLSEAETDEESSQETGSMPPELYKRLQAEMEAALSDPAIFTDRQLNKDRLARLLGTNRTYLSRFINAHYKMSFTQLISSMRIKEAIRILSDPSVDIPLKNVADQVGFNSQTTFYNKFSETTGMTPATFRARARSIATR